MKTMVSELRSLCAVLGSLDAAPGSLGALLWLLCGVIGSLVAVPWSESVEQRSLAVWLWS